MIMKRESLFWRRILSTILDFSAIWCLASVVQWVIRIFTYIAFGHILTVSFIGYYLFSYLLLDGRTVAKVFTGLRVTRKNGNDVRPRDLFLREVILKGFAGIWLPLWLFYLRTTVSLYVAFKMTGILLFSTLLLVVFRRTWWEFLSGTVTVREPVRSRRLPGIAFFTFTCLYLATIALSLIPYLADRTLFQTGYPVPYPRTREVGKCADFIHENGRDPVDYVFGLFEKYDLVIISERMHPEYSQYEFLFKVISDPRFAGRVGNIFTECGSVSYQDSLDLYLRTPYSSTDDLLRATARLARNNNAIWPLWSNTNLFDMFRKVHDLNTALPDSSMIRWYFTDLPVDWTTATHETYQKNYTDHGRDKAMADRVIDVYRAKLSGERRHKALMIMNTYHGFGPGPDGQNLFGGTAGYIMKALPGKVANVLMNGIAQTYLWIFTPVADGKWDAAFRLTGDPPSGFDFAGSPFGDDAFDGRSATVKGLRYKDVFTGLIFYTPLSKQFCRDGYPYMFEQAEQELIQRGECVGQEYAEIIRKMAERYRKNPLGPGDTRPCNLPILYNLIHGIIVPLLLFILQVIVLIAFLVKRERR